jgi:L-ascorbate metabolism protein UlaG (beta-lactamase superfamily)
MGEPAGVLLTIDNKIIYHTGDTGIFYDMKLIGEMNSIDLYLCPIGGNFTMGIDDAIKSIEFVNPKLSAPMHYNTFPIINADPFVFKQKVESLGKLCKVFEYGETIEL